VTAQALPAGRALEGGQAGGLRDASGVDFVNLPLLAARDRFRQRASRALSARIGLSFLLDFLIAGVLAGVDGIDG